MFVTTADLCYMTIVTVNGVSSIIANCFLLFMIVRKSPPQLTPYRIFLGNTALTQLLYSFVTLMIEPRILSNDMSIVVIYLGPAQYLGPWACYMLFITMCHFVVNSFISIMLSMIFRCISLRTLRFPVSGAYAMCAIGYVIPMTMVIGALNIEYVNDYESNSIFINHSVPNLELYRMVVGVRIDQPSVLWVVFCVTVLFVPIYGVMYFCRWKIYRILCRPSFVHNHSTKMIIQKLVKALTVQSIIPLFTVFPASWTYMLTQFGVLQFHMYSYIIVSFLSLATLLDPIVTTYYVCPYWRYASSCLGLCQTDSETTSPRRCSTEGTDNFLKSFRIILHTPYLKNPHAV